MAFELLGPSLEDLFNFCGRRFSLKTTLMILDQLLWRMEHLHSKGVVHRDIKPRNFLMGLGPNGNEIYVTDFGLVHEYTTMCTSPMAIASHQPRLIGTMRFASVAGHNGQGMLVPGDIWHPINVRPSTISERRPRVVGLHDDIFHEREAAMARTESIQQRREGASSDEAEDGRRSQPIV